MGLNLATGLWEDDEHPDGGSLGEQGASPVRPMPPPPTQAPGPMMTPAGPNAGLLEPPQGGTAVPATHGVNPTIPGPSVTPYVPQTLPPIPAGRVVTPAESANLGAIDQNAAARAGTAQDRGALAEQGATANAQSVEREQFLADAQRQERQRIDDDFAKRLQARQAKADADYRAYEAHGIKDPEAEDSFGTKILKAIAIGLGQYASGMNGGSNAALQIITDANRANIERQKAQQEKLFRVAERSGKNVEQAKADRDDAFHQLDLKHAAMLKSSAAMLRGELARIGVPKAQIDANAEIQKIEQESLGIRERTLASIRDDETALARADIMAAARKPKGGAGGGAGKLGAAAALADYAQKNPGDTPGLYRFAATVPGATQKDVVAALNQNKVPEGAQGTAVKAQAALTAIDTIEKLKYVPTRADVQKWMDNQREVYQAQKAGEGGGLGGLVGGFVAGQAQKRGVLAQNEFDGMSPKAAEYFSNVRRYMENIGREASGAAISQSEWNNFYGQYGPQSKGGLAAARQNVENRFRLTGVAGRTLEQSAPEAKGGGGAKPKADDPRVKLAREAIADPNAPQKVKARALQILRSLGEADIKL